MKKYKRKYKTFVHVRQRNAKREETRNKVHHCSSQKTRGAVRKQLRQTKSEVLTPIRKSRLGNPFRLSKRRSATTKIQTPRQHVSAPDLLVVNNPVWSQEEQPCLRTGTRMCLWMFEKLWIFKFCLKSKLKFKFWLVRLGVTAAGADRSSTNDGSASCPCAG